MSKNFQQSFYGSEYDNFVSRNDSSISAFSKVQKQYWVAKQTVIRKFGGKEDDNIVSSDAELDAKLELFQSITNTSQTLIEILEKYQERICNLSQVENALGRFLKDQRKIDQTQAGKMMLSVGKIMSFTAQQRLTLRAVLLRLSQEVETFLNRAVEDSRNTIDTMEVYRNEYRAALLWMKNISQELDPDTYKRLEKFRKVQIQVRRAKILFEKWKTACLQKVDLLAASRCNMFSAALVSYQQSLLSLCDQTSHLLKSVALSFQGYQPFEFHVVKELSESANMLMNQNDKNNEVCLLDEDGKLFFKEEYHDNVINDINLSLRNNETLDHKNITNDKTMESEENLILVENEETSKKSDDEFFNFKDFLSNLPLNDDDNTLSYNDDLIVVNEEFNSENKILEDQFFSDFMENPSIPNNQSLCTSTDNFNINTNGKSVNNCSILSLNVAIFKEISNVGNHYVPPFLPSQLLEMDCSAEMDLKNQCLSNKQQAWSDLFSDLDPFENPSILTSMSLTKERNC